MIFKNEAGSRFQNIKSRETGSLVSRDVIIVYYVYVLKNKYGKHYIGSTSNLESRLKQHNQNCVTSTKNKGPYTLIYQEQFTDKTLARKRENKLKSYKGNSIFIKLLEARSDPIV